MIRTCDTLGCNAPASTQFTATQNGDLGGRPWKAGDLLRFCWPCARKLYHDTDPHLEGKK